MWPEIDRLSHIFAVTPFISSINDYKSVLPFVAILDWVSAEKGAPDNHTVRFKAHLVLLYTAYHWTALPVTFLKLLIESLTPRLQRCHRHVDYCVCPQTSKHSVEKPSAVYEDVCRKTHTCTASKHSLVLL